MKKILIEIDENNNDKFIDWAIKNSITHKIYTYEIGLFAVDKEVALK